MNSYGIEVQLDTMKHRWLAALARAERAEAEAERLRAENAILRQKIANMEGDDR